MTDEQILRSLFDTAVADLHAPRVRVRPHPTVLPLPQPPRRVRRSRSRRSVLTGVGAAAGGVAAAVIALFGLRAGSTTGGHHPGGATIAGPATPPGPVALYRLASAVRALPPPAGRYTVQVEQQSEGSVSYLKATIIDSRTGDTWTYQKGHGVPATLPMAPGFSPTEAQLQASDPTDPARLRAALIAQARADNPAPTARQTPNDLALTRAIDTLWNPLVQPALRSALVSVIASSPGVTTNPHATDAKGRTSIEISYDNAGLGVRLSVYLDPSTGTVLESSQRPYTPTADPSLAGRDVYLSQHWTNTSPTINPLNQ